MASGWAERGRLLRRQASAVVGMCWFLVAMSRLLPRDLASEDPNYVFLAWLAFLARNFELHLGGLAALVAALSWTRARRVATAAGLGLLALTAVLDRPSWGPGARAGEPTLRLATVNLRVGNEEVGRLLEQAEILAADVVVFEEYSLEADAVLAPALRLRFPHHARVALPESSGTAIWSRRPFAGRVERHLPLGPGVEAQMRAELDIDGRRVALYVIHLPPPVGVGFTLDHRAQLRRVLGLLAVEPLPVILAGDFNFTDATSEAAALHALGFVDAHTLCGEGRAPTWLGLLRLDHVYLRGQGLSCARTWRGEFYWSDHLPVLADLVVTP